MAGCGYTPAAIDVMPMQDVKALLAFWHETPPAHEILAVVHGIQPGALPDTNDPSGIGGLIHSTPDGRTTNK